MNKENKLIPKLRFPEFTEPWAIISVSDVCDVYRGGTFSKADMDENGTESCIHYGELFTKYNEVISVIYSKTNKSDGFRSEAGDILMPSSDVTPDGLAKASAIILDNVVLGGDMNILRPKTIINSIFLSYLLNYSKSEIIKLISGTTVKHIYPSQIITCQLPIVKSEPEQQEIASCLSTLDEVISAHSQKLELLNDHKKGLMQNLFSREGGKVPNYRFPEFRGNGEWNEALFGDIVNFSSGGTPSKESPEYWNGTIPWISAASMHTYNIEKSDSNITEVAVAHGAQVAKEGTLLILVRGSMLYNRIPMGIALRDVAFNQDVKALTLVKEMNIHFLLYELMGLESQLLNAVTATGIGAGKLDTNDLKKFIICFPSPDEQQKIASCLSFLDELITSQAEKIEQLKLHKKGLMQSLFPKTID